MNLIYAVGEDRLAGAVRGGRLVVPQSPRDLSLAHGVVMNLRTGSVRVLVDDTDGAAGGANQGRGARSVLCLPCGRTGGRQRGAMLRLLTKEAEEQ